MAKVLLAESFRHPILGQQQNPVLLSGFFQNLLDDLGDFGSGLTGFISDIPGYAHNLTGSAVNTAGQVLQNPGATAGVAGALFGLPGLGFMGGGNLPGQQVPGTTEQPTKSILENPLFLIGGAALLYFAFKK